MNDLAIASDFRDGLEPDEPMVAAEWFQRDAPEADGLGTALIRAAVEDIIHLCDLCRDAPTEPIGFRLYYLHCELWGPAYDALKSLGWLLTDDHQGTTFAEACALAGIEDVDTMRRRILDRIEWTQGAVDALALLLAEEEG